jgi:hypothetical protein
MKGIAAEFPEEIVVSGEPTPTRYVLTVEYYAVFGSLPVGCHEIVSTWQDENIAICRGAPAGEIVESKSSRVSAVYHVGGSGSLAVPTGDVFIRFGERTSMKDQCEAIEKAGFSIKKVLPYAVQAGWVRPTSGKIHHALMRYHRLEHIVGVQTVQPQMLTPTSRR